MNSIVSKFKFIIFSKTKIPRHWINKYTISGGILFLWVAFFDSHSLLDRWKLSRSINKLEREKKEYIAAITKAKEDKLDLENNKEKYAREKYFMHTPNEDVFIIEKPKEKE